MQKTPEWKQILRTNFTHWEKLADFLELTASQRQIISINNKFILNLPLRLAQKMRKSDLDDPLLKQFLPTINEEIKTSSYVEDPTGDMSCRRTSKLLQKYPGRALLICTSACAMHCRYCFRQNFDYNIERDQFAEEISLIAADPSIHEIILSGGDPLSLSDDTLKSLFDKLSLIDHVKRIRIHTRFPIGIPERIDQSFLNLLKSIPKQVWFVIHSNHPKELDEDVLAHLAEIRKLGIVLLNQSVLLKGINDDVQTLKDLCERLVDNGILPYYLHQLDRVDGAAHFEVSEEKGKQLIQELRGQLSGYAIPTYVREIYGESSKTPLN